jgi:GNAT superfamily N-acetyltransferase
MTFKITTTSTENNTLKQVTEVTYRPGTVADSYTVFKLFEETLADLSRRLGSTEPTSWQDPAALERMWQERRSLYEHLARSAAHFWLAFSASQVIGFGRSILRDGLLELTEFFVRPDQQARGVGQELLLRVFPKAEVAQRSVIASTDIPAQVLYLKAGAYPRFPIYYFWRTPTPALVATDLSFEPITASSKNLAILGKLDRAIIGHRRDIDHEWLLTQRQGYLYYRQGQPAGYGYAGLRNGPFALLHPGDFPAVLAHAEDEAAANGWNHFGLEVPMVNRTAVDYLLTRNFRMDSFMTIFMSDLPFGRFENYILTSPPLFL